MDGLGQGWDGQDRMGWNRGIERSKDDVYSGKQSVPPNYPHRSRTRRCPRGRGCEGAELVRVGMRAGAGCGRGRTSDVTTGRGKEGARILAANDVKLVPKAIEEILRQLEALTCAGEELLGLASGIRQEEVSPRPDAIHVAVLESLRAGRETTAASGCAKPFVNTRRSQPLWNGLIAGCAPRAHRHPHYTPLATTESTSAPACNPWTRPSHPG